MEEEVTVRKPTRSRKVTTAPIRRSERTPKPIKPVKSNVKKNVSKRKKEKLPKSVEETLIAEQDFHHKYPTYPYPPMGHAHQKFDPPSPMFELTSDPTVSEPVLPEIDIPEIGAEVEIGSAISPTEWPGWSILAVDEGKAVVQESSKIEMADKVVNLKEEATIEEIVEKVVDLKKEAAIEEVEEKVDKEIKEKADKDVKPTVSVENVQSKDILQLLDEITIPVDGEIGACSWAIDTTPNSNLGKWEGEKFVYDLDSAKDGSGDDPVSDMNNNTPVIRSVVIIPPAPSMKLPDGTAIKFTTPLAGTSQLLSPTSPVHRPKTVKKGRTPKRVVLYPSDNQVTPNTRQPKRFILDRFPENHQWMGLKTFPERGDELPGFFPTHWLTVNGNYVKEFLSLKKPHFINSVELRMSAKDAAYVTIETKFNGEMYMTRFGQRAKIRSATGDPIKNGGQVIWDSIPRAKGPQGEKLHTFLKGIRSQDIPLGCPYWNRLLIGLYYPDEGEVPYPRTSSIDHVPCLVYIESNGRVSIRRDGYRIELLPPF